MGNSEIPTSNLKWNAWLKCPDVDRDWSAADISPTDLANQKEICSGMFEDPQS